LLAAKYAHLGISRPGIWRHRQHVNRGVALQAIAEAKALAAVKQDDLQRVKSEPANSV
jgi:hypothetical protein